MTTKKTAPLKKYNVRFTNLSTAVITAADYKTAGRIAKETAIKNKTLVSYISEIR